MVMTGMIFTGCGTRGPVYMDPPVMSGETFRMGDQVTISFSGVEEPPPAHTERIKEDGKISLDYVGAVEAVGKTPGQLQREIRALYVPKYYRDITVTVISQSQFYSVGGEVRAPGPKEYNGQMDIVKAIQSAGDFTEYASKKKVLLTRANGHQERVNVLKAIEDPRFDVPVYPGDKIYVPRRLF
jgi:polysaccharide export outer membrane protein